MSEVDEQESMSEGPGGEHGTKAVIAAFAANLGIAVMKFIGFALTGSGAMLAEAVHSFADTGNQLLLMLGGRKSRRMADEDHPFGYGRERFFWAFVVAVMLFSVGSLFSIFDGVEKLLNPHELEDTGIAIAILMGSFVLEALSFRTGIHETRKIKSPTTSWWHFIRRAKNPELPIVLLEDFAALIGLVLAMTAITLAEVTGDSRYDALGSIGIGLLLGVVACVLAIEMRSLLLGEAADPAVQQKIRDAIEGDERVVRLIHLRTEHLGPEELLVAAKIEFVPELSIEQLALVVDDVETKVRAAVPEAHVMYLEPDVYRVAPPAT
jgi:cation diffusion facilitator family transporter